MAGIPILENVKDIYQIFQKQVTVFALPMKIKNGSGAPVRIVAVENYQICKSWMEFYLWFLYVTCNYIFSKKILATVRRHEWVEVASLQISLQIQKWQFGNLVEWWLWDYLEEKIFVKRKFPGFILANRWLSPSQFYGTYFCRCETQSKFWELYFCG